MQHFARLLDELSNEQSRTGKLGSLEVYFKSTPDPDRGWALAMLTDNVPVRLPLRRMLSDLVGQFFAASLFWRRLAARFGSFFFAGLRRRGLAAALVNDAAMSMIGVFTKANVSDDQQIRRCLLHSANRLLHDAAVAVRARSVGFDSSMSGFRSSSLNALFGMCPSCYRRATANRLDA